MKSLLITSAAVVCALLTVLSTRLIVPALILVYRYIEESFAPQEPALVPVLAAATEPVVVTEEVAPKKRAVRKRKTTAKVQPLTAVEGFA